MQDPTYETIGDYRFSKWKSEPKPEKFPRLSTGFFQVAIVSVVVILITGKLAIDQMRNGNFLVGKIWLIVLLAVYVVPIFIAPFVLMRKRAQKIAPEDAPSHLPSHAIRVWIRLRGANASRGSSRGWLWVDGEWLRFSGENFDFRLRPSDFKTRGDILKEILRGWVYVQTPKKISPNLVYIAPYRERDNQTFTTPEAWQRLKPALETWLRAPKSLEPSLYPPLRGNVAGLTFKSFLKAIGTAAAIGGGLGLAVSLAFAEYLPNGPIQTSLGMAGLSAMVIAPLPLQNLNYKTFDQEVDRAQAA